MTEFFILSYDMMRLKVPHDKFLIYLKNSKIVDDWHSPFDGCVIIISDSNAEDLSRMVYEFVGSLSPFFLVKVSDDEMLGSVPGEVWEWFKKPRRGLQVKLPETPGFD